VSSKDGATGLDWRVGVTIAAGSTVGVGMLLFGMQPRLPLVGLVVIILGAATWLLLDLGNAASPLVWHDYGAGEAGAPRPDRRVRMLQSRLERRGRPGRRRGAADGTGSEHTDEIVITLLGSIDDHLEAEHGIDRSIDPVAAAEVLGVDLTRFVTDPAARRSMTQRRTLARTVSLIEAL
jgi:hypothetical protein